MRRLILVLLLILIGVLLPVRRFAGVPMAAPVAAQFGGSGDCTSAIQIASTITPGAVSTGILTFTVGPEGAIDTGSLALDGQPTVSVAGQATGRVIDLLIPLADGTTLSLHGLAGDAIATCGSPMQGIFVNPATGQIGAWVAGADGAVLPAPVVSAQPAQPAGQAQPAQPTPTTIPATDDPTPTPTPEMAIDTDGDGLTDAEEASLGTNPNDPDSDMDGLSDGNERNVYGTNPLNDDTDSDGLGDHQEIDLGADPNKPDTDGDGLGDAFEGNSGFSDPALADTDGDGDDDLTEFSLGTDPRDPNCFSGPGSVCQG